MIAVLLFSLILTPINLAFPKSDGDENFTSLITNISIDITFFIDMIVTFNTAYSSL